VTWLWRWRARREDRRMLRYLEEYLAVSNALHRAVEKAR
jgi:hypothetical protein